MKWRIIKSGKMSPAENMAIDEAIFEGNIAGRSEPTIRFYDWNPPTVSCGYNQEAEKEVDFELLDKFGFGFVRRPTGGRLVLHYDEITYAVIAPVKGLLKGNITDSYLMISTALAQGLNMLGINVELEKGSLSSDHQRKSSNPCFTSSSRFELTCCGKKIVGSAQVRRNDVLLQHGSILHIHDQSKVANIIPNLTFEQKEKLAHHLSRKTTAINKILNKPVSFEKAVNTLENGFRKTWKSEEFFQSESLLSHEIKRADYLINNKYSTIEWNKRK